MTLLELLVKELPSRGGWPSWANRAIKHSSFASVNFYNEVGNATGAVPDIYQGKTTYDEKVTRNQYEAALAAPQQPVKSEPLWDGKGLPPVGVQCEVDSPTLGWVEAKITAVTDNFLIAQYPDTAEYCIPHRLKNSDGTFSYSYDRFRPIRTEAERKREKGVMAMVDLAITCDNHTDYQFAVELYDAIAAGKIPGVEIKK